ncbi:MAG: hypothetical protein H7144_09860 [Burkholderiales bacterium]|nr:hypothetical protein [Phycisphaerae bacterium]
MAEIAGRPGKSIDSTKFGFALLVALIAMIGIGKAVLADTMDPDAFWHFRVADQLVREGIGPLVDTLSYASDKTPWTPYSWLAELVMKRVWDLGGYRATNVVTAACSGLIIVAMAMTCATVAANQVPQLRRSPSYFSAAIATAIGAYFTLPFLSFRPVTFALALLAIIVYLLYRDRARGLRTRAVWIIPLLVLIQTNLHIYSVFSVAVVMLVAIGAFFENRPRFRRLALLAMLTAVAACGTPMLKGMIDTSVRYNAVDPMVAANFIREMRPFYEGTGGKVSLAIVLMTLGFSIAKRDRLRLTDWLLLGFGVLVIARLGRFAPVFALISMPILARVMPALSDRVLGKRLVRFAMAIVLIIGGVNIARGFPRSDLTLNQWLNRFAPEIPGYPTAAADWALANVPPSTHRIINEFDWGGYLAWRLGDQWQVLLDGRTQLYAPEFWRQAFFDSPDAQRALLEKCDADFAIVPKNRSAFRASLDQLGWKVAYEDDVAAVLVR